MNPRVEEALAMLAQTQRPQDQAPVMPESGGVGTQDDARRLTTGLRYNDEQLIRMFRDKGYDLSQLNLQELERLDQMTKVIGGSGALVPVAPPNPERPWQAMDPQLMTPTWHGNRDDAENFLRQFEGVDPLALRGVQMGMPSPLPGAYSFRRR